MPGSYCKDPNCFNHPMSGSDYCFTHHIPVVSRLSKEAHTSITEQLELETVVGGITQITDVPMGTNKQTSSGADNDYWVADITDPKRLAPYKAECDDIIEFFEMSYQEGEAFKAIWRNGMIRKGGGKPGDSTLRNAEKTHYYGGRWLKQEQRKAKKS